MAIVVLIAAYAVFESKEDYEKRYPRMLAAYRP